MSARRIPKTANGKRFSRTGGVGVYICVHFIEGNFITPLIQAEATSLPPAITLLAVISCAILFGPSAAFLAAPLILFVITALDVLYAEPMVRQETTTSHPPSHLDEAASR